MRDFASKPRNIARFPRSGFTLVELLVVVAIIGILVGLLMPAVQNSRETGRRAHCTNNLRQMGLACQSHISTHGFYPTGGWAHNWVGDPDRGFREQQPGGWIYNLLPYLDNAPLHDMGKGKPESEKKKLAAEMIQTPLSLFICPTRRRPTLYPVDSSHNGVNHDRVDKCARTDYAANVGAKGGNELTSGPKTLKEGDEKFSWPSPSAYNGITYCRSIVTPGNVRDGATNTILYGEKLIRASSYIDGSDSSDNHCMYIGFDNDLCRITTYVKDKLETTRDNAPMLDDPDYASAARFGSAHVAGCNFVMCDGSIRTIGYSVDPELFSYLGSRDDGKPTDWTKF